MGGFAWVTLATNDSYSLGALILAHSLKQAGTSAQLAVLVTPGVTSSMKEKLATVFNLVQEVNILDSKDEANLRLLKRPELGVTFTKLHCWRLTQFEKCVFLDADTMVLQNCDELFEREELSAAPDVGWPDCFNSGVFVFRPSNETYDKLVQFALEKGSFDGGDQGLLNLYFSDWAHKDISKHLPFIYNMCSTACYSYLPAFKQFGGNAKIIHFIGPAKPWLQYFDSETRKVSPSGGMQHLQHILQKWWDLFCEKIHPILSREMTGLAGAFAQLTLGAPRSAEQMALEDHLRRQGWEVGNIDYLGRDSFENIWSKICETLAEPTETPKEAAATPASTPKEAVATPASTPKEAAATPASTPVKTKATKAPSLTASELQSTEQLATEEVVTEKVIEKATEAPQQIEVPKEAAPASETTRHTEQVVPTTQVLPPTPTSPLALEVSPLKTSEAKETPEASPLPLPVTEVSSPPPKPEQTPALPSEIAPKVEAAECPIPAKVEADQAKPAECPLPAKVEAECPLPAKVEAECPMPAKIEPASCPLIPKPESPVKVDSPPVVTTECSVPPKVEAPKPEFPVKVDSPPVTTECSVPLKVEAPPEPAPVECSLPQPTEPTIAVCSLPPAETECPLPAKTEPSLAASVAEEKTPQTPVETPIVPEIPEVVASKVPESTPKAQEAIAAKAPEPSSPKPESTPTPPPRKGSGGSKKSPKSKK